MPLVDGKFEPLTLPSEKHQRVLFDSSKPWRYRVLHGGRNGYKDWSVCQAIVEICLRTSKRCLFTREVQLTIADSAHALLRDTIKRLGYTEYFTVHNNRITCNVNDSSIIFRGLNEMVSGDIKSMEGIDICVVMEAEGLQRKSFEEDLDPTIRKDGSEIWIIFNTKQASDFVYQFCVIHPPENMIRELVNYTDTNDLALCSQVIRDQAERMKVENYELYRNVWLGEPLTIGLFFPEFGEHNRCTPFIIPDSDNERLFASLDHGIVHNTSFGLFYVNSSLDIFRMFTYCRNGGVTRTHAEAILEQLEAFSLSRYQFPRVVFYDYAMDEKHKTDEWNYRSDLDVYKEVFAAHRLGKNVRFVPANKRKIDGCSAMRSVFKCINGKPQLFYYSGYNDEFEAGIKAVVQDKINPEIYAKMEGDDVADECRYGIMGIISFIAGIKQAQNNHRNGQRPTKIEPLVNHIRHVFFSRKKVMV
jgi:phage terminase large subunit